MIQTTTPIETKTCTNCWQDKPITEFRRRRRDTEKRHNQCRECFAEYMRQYRARATQDSIARFVRELSRSETRPGTMTVMCARMIRRFGGVDRFAAAWKNHFDAIAMERPHSRLMFQNVNAVMKLVMASDRARQRKPDVLDRLPPVERMTDEELELELQLWRELGITPEPDGAM
jgi:hypothetical protein